MRFTFTAPSLNKPTHDTLGDYATIKFSKLEKLLPKTDMTNYEVRISVKKEGDEYDLMADIIGMENDVVHAKDRDIRKVVDVAFDRMKGQLTKGKGRRIRFSRIRDKIRGFIRR